jgi:hypothetical protein
LERYNGLSFLARKNMSEHNTDRGTKLPGFVLSLLKSHNGSFSRVAQRCKVSNEHVTMVAHGRRRSLRVTYALIREAMRLARIRSAQAAVDLERARAVESQPARVERES